MKKLIRLSLVGIIILVSNTIIMLGEVDKDCLCSPEMSNKNSKVILAIDSCIFYDIYNYEFVCKDVLFSQRGADFVNNIDSSYMFGRRNIFITSKKPLFKNYFNEMDTLQSIENIKDKYIEIKNYFEDVVNEFGEFEFYFTNGNKVAALFFKEFQSLPALKYYFSNINSIFSGDTLRYEILSFTVTTSNIKNSTAINNTNLLMNENILFVEVGTIESVIAYDLYGRKIESYEDIHSNTLNLSGLKGAFILRVKTNNSIQTIKYFSN